MKFPARRRLGVIFSLLPLLAFPIMGEEPSAGLTAEEAAAAVLKHIRTQTAKHGSFWVYDSVADKSLSLQLEEMHPERFGLLGDLTYFASAKFKDPAGNPVMVDIVMRGPDADDLELLEVTVQERDGQERYAWQHDGGVWKRSGEGA